MKQTKLIMGMPITIQLVDDEASQADFNAIFDYFHQVDDQYSPYKSTSEVCRLNNGEITLQDVSLELQDILHLCELTKQETDGYFDCVRDGKIDPSGLVKGWAIWQAAQLLKNRGIKNFYIEAGGDIQVSGLNEQHQPWRVGIRNPFQGDQIVKVLAIDDLGVATSGSYERGDHVYNPHQLDQPVRDVVSLTIVGPNIYEADRFATAAFAMGEAGIQFVERLPGFEGYQIDSTGQATMTSHFENFVSSGKSV